MSIHIEKYPESADNRYLTHHEIAIEYNISWIDLIGRCLFLVYIIHLSPAMFSFTGEFSTFYPQYFKNSIFWVMPFKNFVQRYTNSILSEFKPIWPIRLFRCFPVADEFLNFYFRYFETVEFFELMQTRDVVQHFLNSFLPEFELIWSSGLFHWFFCYSLIFNFS